MRPIQYSSKLAQQELTPLGEHLADLGLSGTLGLHPSGTTFFSDDLMGPICYWRPTPGSDELLVGSHTLGYQDWLSLRLPASYEQLASCIVLLRIIGQYRAVAAGISAMEFAPGVINSILPRSDGWQMQISADGQWTLQVDSSGRYRASSEQSHKASRKQRSKIAASLGVDLKNLGSELVRIGTTFNARVMASGCQLIDTGSLVSLRSTKEAG